jgi:hypothetical protein
LGFGSTDEGRVQHVVRVHLDILEPSNVAKNIFISTTINYPMVQEKHFEPHPSGATKNDYFTARRDHRDPISWISWTSWTMLHPSPLQRPKPLAFWGSPGSSLGGEIPDTSVVI